MCLRFLAAAAKDHECEIVIVDNDSPWMPILPGWVRCITVPWTGGLFNKPRLLNAGSGLATGDTLTFLDCDMLVGREWFRSLDALGDVALTKVCHRARFLPKEISMMIGAEDNLANELASSCWDEYDKFPLEFEARVKPDTPRPDGGPLFGNSQFSIRRDVLGDLRFNEDFAGGGFEDIWMNRELWRRDPGNYRAVMFTDPARCLFHISHSSRNPEWRTPEVATANRKRYLST